MGYIDSKAGLLNVRLESSGPGAQSSQTGKRRAGLSGKAASHARRKGAKEDSLVLEVAIQQDLQRLHSQGGGTGSIVWRARYAKPLLKQIFPLTQTVSVDLAKLILGQRGQDSPFIDTSHLADASVLELGAGTGILATLLGPLCKSWIATDIEALLPLISKNITRNCPTKGASIEARELDWTWSRKQLEQNYPNDQTIWDVVIAVDCLYNETLVQPFVDTLEKLPCRAVVVVVELRSPDVLRVFLDRWLALGGWQIWRVVDATGESGILGDNQAVWVGWK